MLLKYLQLAIRQFFRKRSFFLINIGGLSLSLAISAVIALWVWEESQVNRFHDKGNRIAQIHMTYKAPNGATDFSYPASYPLGKAMAEEIPEVEQTAIVQYTFDRILEAGDQKLKSAGSASTLNLFDIFSFPLITGNLESAKDNLNSILLSESLAMSLFGSIDATVLGQNVTINDDDSFVVEGIFQDVPQNSTLQFEYVLNLEKVVKYKEWMKGWGNNVFSVYALLADQDETIAVAEKTTAIYAKSPAFEEGQAVILHPFEKTYLYSRFEDGKAVGGRIGYLRIFTGAAIFLLLISCINFINLSTARASRRAREVGVRKVVGANKGILLVQFLFENSLVVLFSILVSIGLLQWLLPFARTITQKDLVVDYSQPMIWLALLGLLLSTSLLSGFYPALVLSSFQPVQVLKGKLGIDTNDGWFRKGLVVLQFGLSFLLIVGAFMVRSQIHFIKNENLGLDRENLIYINMDHLVSQHYSVLAEELSNQPSIAAVTSTSHVPIAVDNATTDVQWAGKQPEQKNIYFRVLWVESDFLSVFNVPMAEGRFFDAGRTMDTTSIVINRTAADLIGEQAEVGKQIEFWEQKATVRGIVEDFHMNSLYDPLEPMVMVLDAGNTWSMFVKTEPGETEASLASIQSVFQKVLPGYELDYEFLDDRYEAMYQGEITTGKLADIFAILAILISCLGLFGLAAFTADQRTKEIGIRKVLGASLTDILILLNKEFGKLLLLSFALAVPASFYLLKGWLSKFSYHADLGWQLYIGTGLAIILLAALTVSFHSIRTALVNPADSLRDE